MVGKGNINVQRWQKRFLKIKGFQVPKGTRLTKCTKKSQGKQWVLTGPMLKMSNDSKRNLKDQDLKGAPKGPSIEKGYLKVQSGQRNYKDQRFIKGI